MVNMHVKRETSSSHSSIHLVQPQECKKFQASDSKNLHMVYIILITEKILDNYRNFMSVPFFIVIYWTLMENI